MIGTPKSTSFKNNPKILLFNKDRLKGASGCPTPKTDYQIRKEEQLDLSCFQAEHMSLKNRISAIT